MIGSIHKFALNQDKLPKILQKIEVFLNNFVILKLIKLKIKAKNTKRTISKKRNCLMIQKKRMMNKIKTKSKLNFNSNIENF